MPLITLRDVQLSFGGPLLLENVSLSIEPGERVCLIGRNGTGKSSLMKLITGEYHPDDGEIVTNPGLRVTRLTQEVPDSFSGLVFDVVAGGLDELGELIKEYHHVSHALAEAADLILPWSG